MSKFIRIFIFLLIVAGNIFLIGKIVGIANNFLKTHALRIPQIEKNLVNVGELNPNQINMRTVTVQVQGNYDPGPSDLNPTKFYDVCAYLSDSHFVDCKLTNYYVKYVNYDDSVQMPDNSLEYGPLMAEIEGNFVARQYREILGKRKYK